MSSREDRRPLKRQHTDTPRSHVAKGVKRRRMCTLSKAVPPTKQHQLEPSPFHAAKPSTNALRAKIKYHINRYNKHQMMQKKKQSNNSNLNNNNLNNNNLDNNKLYPSTSQSHTVDSDSSSSNDNRGNDNDSGHDDDDLKQPSTSQADPPIFTISQLEKLCEGDLRKKEMSLRNQYEQVLSCRLADQYEDFLKFNSDVMCWGAGEVAASYVS